MNLVYGNAEAIARLKGNLYQFWHDMEEVLEAVTFKIQQTQEWLDEAHLGYRHHLEFCQEAILQTYAHELSENHANISDAYNQLREAQEQFDNFLHWKRQIEEAISEYQRQAVRMKAQLDDEVAKAEFFLKETIAKLEEYFERTLHPVINRLLQGMREGTHHHTRWMIQGKAGEMVALLSGNRFLLDNIAAQLRSVPVHGKFFVLYDNLMSQGNVASVKTRGVITRGKSLSQKKLQTVKDNYLKDFNDAIGQGNLDKFEKAATLLLEAKEKKLIPIPNVMQNVTTIEEMKEYLRQYGELQIPSDHVKMVQEEVRKQYETLGVERVNQLVGRVNPIGADSKLIGEMLQAYQTYPRLTLWKKTRNQLDELKNELLQKQRLIQKLDEQGFKHSPNLTEILRIAETATGKVVFLEKGKNRATTPKPSGLAHILEDQRNNFVSAGIPSDKIPEAVMAAVTRGKIVGQQRSRPIYQVDIDGQTYCIAVTVASNGYIVGANPTKCPTP